MLKFIFFIYFDPFMFCEVFLEIVFLIANHLGRRLHYDSLNKYITEHFYTTQITLHFFRVFI